MQTGFVNQNKQTLYKNLTLYWRIANKGLEERRQDEKLICETEICE